MVVVLGSFAEYRPNDNQCDKRGFEKRKKKDDKQKDCNTVG